MSGTYLSRYFWCGESHKGLGCVSSTAPHGFVSRGAVWQDWSAALRSRCGAREHHKEHRRCKYRMMLLADLAQLVEQLSCKQQVKGSSPLVGSHDDAVLHTMFCARLWSAGMGIAHDKPNLAGRYGAVCQRLRGSSTDVAMANDLGVR